MNSRHAFQSGCDFDDGWHLQAGLTEFWNAKYIEPLDRYHAHGQLLQLAIEELRNILSSSLIKRGLLCQ